MFAIAKADLVTQPLYRLNRLVHGRKLRTRSEPWPATSSPDRIAPRTQWRAFPHQLSGFLSGMRAAVREWRQRKNGRLELARFDERMLRDIGLTRFDAEYEINKPFWRV